MSCDSFILDIIFYSEKKVLRCDVYERTEKEPWRIIVAIISIAFIIYM